MGGRRHRAGAGRRFATPARLWSRARAAVAHRWRALPERRRRFLASLFVSLLIACGIEVTLQVLHTTHHPRLEAIEDQAIDWILQIDRGSTPRREDAVPFTVVDVDDETYHRWGEPLFLPRERIASLIAGVAAAEPRLVVVDIDLTRASGAPGDQALVEVITAYPEDAPPLILPRRLRRPLAAEDRGHGEGHGHAGGPALQERGSFLDPFVDGKPNIFWGSPLFVRSRSWSIRRWQLWQSVEARGGNHGGAGDAVPSIQLLAAALSCGPEQLSAAQRVRGLGQRLAAPEAAMSSGVLGPGCPRVDPKPARLSQRIVYRYPAPRELRRGEVYPRASGAGPPMLTVVAAHPLTTGQTVSPELFRDRIVVIGGSFADGRDLHPTPLGTMSGALVLVNAIDSLLEHGEIRVLPWPSRYAIVVGLVVVLALIFAAFDSIRAGFLASLALIVLLVPLSFMLFKEGYWLDFAVPLVGVLIHKLAGELEEIKHRLSGGTVTASASKGG